MRSDDERIHELARILISARERGEPLGPLPERLIPPSTDVANRVDDVVAELSGWPVFGWKIGCTSTHAQDLLGASGPFAGRVYTVFESGVTLGDDVLMAEPHLEGEFAFTLADAVRPDSRPHDRSSIEGLIAGARPAIEFVGGRFADFYGTPLNCLVADAGANSHLVLGETTTVDLSTLAASDAVMTVDGDVTGRGTGADVMGDPLDALVWLANHLGDRGITLDAGHVVTTGTATQVSPLPPGATATATLAGIGSVSVTRSR